MRSLQKSTPSYGIVIAAFCLLFLIFAAFLMARVHAALDSGERLISVHDGGRDRGLLTQATTLRQAFSEAGIAIDVHDRVEPGLDEELVASNYEVNIYRARPIIIADGAIRHKIMTPYQTAEQIAKDANITLQKEDITTISANSNIVSEGAGLQMAIDRAMPFTLLFYGTKTASFTQGKTVGEMLEEKAITLDKDDTLSVPLSTAMTAGMTVELWRNGKQTATEEQSVPFETEKIYDVDQPAGYRQIKTAGVAGKKTVTFEIEMRNGQEVSRKEIQSIVSQQPSKQVEVIGVKSGSGLTKAKGVAFYQDSQGVVHRETYYDLAMNKVMGNCGGGTYSVRADGAKIDKDGYILIAANLSRYPRCSIVETSLGLGKVYDTGGFASVHPDGFDLATDWTNNNGI